MLSGENPDAEIDRLLESFGVQISQIGLLPTNSFFKDQLPGDDVLMTELVREQIDELHYIYKYWATSKITDKQRKKFLSKLSE